MQIYFMFLKTNTPALGRLPWYSHHDKYKEKEITSSQILPAAPDHANVNNVNGAEQEMKLIARI